MMHAVISVLYVITAIICSFMVFRMCKNEQGHVTIGDLGWICVLSLIPAVNVATIMIFGVIYLEDKYGRNVKKFFDTKVF